MAQSGGDAVAVPVTLRFGIDAAGRPHGIVREAGTPGSDGVRRLSFDTSDVEPTLAASRFEAGLARSDCTITYRASAAPIGSAPMPVLSALAAHGRLGLFWREATARLRPVDSTCAGARSVRPLVLVFTDPERIDLTPGSLAWTVLSHDIDAQGTARNVRTIAAAGTPTLDREARRAIGASQFVKAPRMGCLRWYTDRSDNSLEAPARPAKEKLEPGNPSCPVPGAQLVNFASKPAFPPAFNRRGIEGWAFLRFDVAPWGDIGNVEVVASEPAAAFGEAARNSLRGAKVKSPGVAYTGCLAPVAYRLAESGADDEAGWGAPR